MFRATMLSVANHCQIRAQTMGNIAPSAPHADGGSSFQEPLHGIDADHRSCCFKEFALHHHNKVTAWCLGTQRLYREAKGVTCVGSTLRWRFCMLHVLPSTLFMLALFGSLVPSAKQDFLFFIISVVPKP